MTGTDSGSPSPATGTTRVSDSVHEVRLDNGFRALLVERPGLPVVGTALWYRVGGRDERDGESGLSHFLEHMMFKGTDRYAKGEIDLLTSRMGGANNAFTDHDSTVYHFSLPSKAWETALEIEANRMRGCTLDPDEFTAEKSVVLEELAMGLDDPWSALFQATESLAFERHPYHRPIIGWKEELEAVGVDGMRRYYEANYGANRAFLVVCGAIDAARTGDRVRDLFGNQPQAEPRRPILAEPEPEGERRRVIYAPGKLARIAVAIPTGRVGEHEDLVLDVLAQVLGHAKSSRLHRRLVLDEQVATQVGVHNDVRLDPGLFWIYAELHPGVEPARVEGMIRAEIARMTEHGVAADELARAQTQIRSSFLFEDEAVLGTALKIGRFEGTTAVGYTLLDSFEAQYAAITDDDVRALLAKRFGADRWTVVWSLPEERKGRVMVGEVG